MIRAALEHFQISPNLTDNIIAGGLTLKTGGTFQQ